MQTDSLRTRNAVQTRARIVEAARAEFAAKGYAGARMESIARAAGVKKELIYHYFRGKEHIFDEIRGLQNHKDLQWDDDPVKGDAASMFARRFDTMLTDVEWIRLITWEAALGIDTGLPAEAGRKKSLRNGVAALRRAQSKGEFPDDLDPRLLQLAVFALATYPLAFSQITRFVTGKSASDKAFQKQWGQFLRTLGEKLLAPKEK